MQLMTVDLHGVRFVEALAGITRTEDALDLIVACIEHDSGRLLIESSALPPAFFDLGSGFAGEFLQKLVNYHLRLATVFPSGGTYSNRFREFLLEARRGRDFRVFTSRAEAEAWLIAD